MYDFVDRPVTSLNRGGRFLIWAMRQWVDSLEKGRCPCGAIGPAFNKWKLMAGFPHFHLMMALLNRDAAEKFRFGPIGYERVTEHEALIVHLVRTVRDMPPERMRETAALMICEGSVPPLLIAMSALAEALSEENLRPEPPVFDPDCASFRHE